MAVKKTSINEILRETALDIIQSDLSDLMKDREKLTTDDLLGEEITIVACDLVDFNDSHYTVVHLAEYPENYYAGGFILTKLIDGLVEKFGSIEQLNAEMKKGGLRIMLDTGKTKGKKNITLVNIL